MSVQRIVEDSPQIDLQAEAQHTTGEVENPVRINLKKAKERCFVLKCTLEIEFHLLRPIVNKLHLFVQSKKRRTIAHNVGLPCSITILAHLYGLEIYYSFVFLLSKKLIRCKLFSLLGILNLFG